MAFALVVSTSKGSTDGNGPTTSAVDTTGASLLVVAAVGSSAAGSLTVTDAVSATNNTWTRLTLKTATSLNVALFYATNPIVGSGHTFTAPGTTTFGALAVLALSGANTSSPFDQENGNQTAAGTTLKPGSVTPGSNNEIVLTCFGINPGGSTSIDVGTILETVTFSGGLHYGLTLAYLIQTTAGPVDPTWTTSVSGESAATIATFLSSGGGVTFPSGILNTPLGLL